MTGNNAKSKTLVLQRRDEILFDALGRFRIIDREQAQLVAGFNSTTRANARLLHLNRAGFLRRFFIATPRRGIKALYALSSKGAAAVGAPYRAVQRKQNDTLTVDPFVEHQLRLNSIVITVGYQPIPVPQTSFGKWEVFREPLTPASPIIPDAYLEVQAAQGVHSMFLEVDLGTESRDTWKRKTEGYLRLAVSGEFATRFHRERFRVLVVAPSDRRLDSIRKAVVKLTDKLFWFSTFDAINRDGFWSEIWVRSRTDQKLSLL